MGPLPIYFLSTVSIGGLSFYRDISYFSSKFQNNYAVDKLTKRIEIFP